MPVWPCLCTASTATSKQMSRLCIHWREQVLAGNCLYWLRLPTLSYSLVGMKKLLHWVWVGSKFPILVCKRHMHSDAEGNYAPKATNRWFSRNLYFIHPTTNLTLLPQQYSFVRGLLLSLCLDIKNILTLNPDMQVTCTKAILCCMTKKK